MNTKPCNAREREKAKSHTLAEQLEVTLVVEALENPESRDPDDFVLAFSGGARLTVRRRNVLFVAAKLRAIRNPGKARHRGTKYPKFEPGMSTSGYVIKYMSLNSNPTAPSLPFRFEPLSRVPCTLYAGRQVDFDAICEVEAEAEAEALAAA